MVENKVYLGLGTNLGKKLVNLKNAIDVLSKDCGTIEEISSIYESDPWGFKSNSNFLNMVVVLKTNLDPENLLIAIKEIESKMGREPKKGEVYESRIIDLDILYFNEKDYNFPNLKIPHPYIKERSFVYLPLLEVLNKGSKYKNELERIPDKEILKKINKSKLLSTNDVIGDDL